MVFMETVKTNGIDVDNLTFEEQLARYAELIVKVGVNLQPGQDVLVQGQVENAPLIRLITEKAYDAGAREVHISWGDQVTQRLKYERAADDVFTTFPQWEVDRTAELMERGAARISITGADPSNLSGVDPQRLQNSQIASGKAMSKFMNAMQANLIAWTVVAAPTEKWAQRVFPHAASSAEAIQLLWNAIFTTVHLDAADPVAAWDTHNKNLHARATYLNERHYKQLHYTAPGTDLTVGLAPKHLWLGASNTTQGGLEFMANMPTEEVFTAPNRHDVNGYVSSTKPLVVSGNVVRDFKLTFEAGRVVGVEAREGEVNLKKLIETDAGAAYLGEVALVPQVSPISSSGILFFNTLFDENASNHLALGSGYAFNIDGGTDLDRDQLAEECLNNSIIHDDFMIGSEDMDIDGIRADGTVEPIFRKGAWAF
jgi:aminopeptidase